MVIDRILLWVAEKPYRTRIGGAILLCLDYTLRGAALFACVKYFYLTGRLFEMSFLDSVILIAFFDIITDKHIFKLITGGKDHEK